MMRTRVISGALFAFLAACGGGIDTSAPVAVESPTDDPPAQGVYDGPANRGAETLTSEIGTPTAMVMTDDYVVVTTSDTLLQGERASAGALFLVEKRPAPALMIALDHQGASFDALAIDGKTAFVATSDARILAVPLAGGEPKTLGTLDDAATTISASNGYVYVATKAGGVGRIAEGGGELMPLATITGGIRSLTADDTAVYVATGTSEEVAAGIQRIAMDGTVKALTSGSEPCAIIRDDRTLFWTVGGQVKRLSLDGGDATTVASGSFEACALAVDSASLWFAGSGGLLRAPLAGGAPVAVNASSAVLAQPGAMAVDGGYVYWLTNTAVLRLAK